jgi:hypothetical protein
MRVVVLDMNLPYSKNPEPNEDAFSKSTDICQDVGCYPSTQTLTCLLNMSCSVRMRCVHCEARYAAPVSIPNSKMMRLQRAELPTSAEILEVDGDSATSDVVEIAPSKVEGSWESKGEYWLVTPPSRCKH